MTRARGLLGLLALVALTALLVFLAPWWLIRPATTPTPCQQELQSAWKTEDEWLVTEIVRDLVEMVAFTCDAAAYRKTPPRVEVRRGASTFHVTVGFPCLATQQEIKLNRSVWSPEEYAPFVVEAMRAAALNPTAPTADSALLTDLLDLRTETLTAANGRVSRRLEASLMDAGAHEDAALILAAFALREAAGEFSDTRRVLCRATSHLSMALALRSGAPSSPEGVVAQAALLSLAGRGADATRALEVLQTMPAVPSAWTHALRLRVDDDWRVPVGTTLMERLALYRTTADVFGPTRAIRLLKDIPPSDAGLPDWGRMTVDSGQTVESGWEFAVDGVEREIAALQKAREGMALPSLEQSALSRETNATPQRCVTPGGPQVLDWSLWAEAFQRHASLYVVLADIHLREMIGSATDADEQRQSLDTKLSGMDLLPLAAVLRASVVDRKDRAAAAANAAPAVNAASTLASRRPEVVSPRAWAAIEKLAPEARLACAPPSRASWFGSGFPFGTTHNSRHRVIGLDIKMPFETLHDLSPDDYGIGMFRLGVQPQLSQSAAGIAVAHGRRAEYDRRVVWRMAYTGQFIEETRLSTQQRLCEIEPQDCESLGAELVGRNDDVAAATAYERALDSLEPVTRSNVCGFLVRYYQQSRQGQRARALAQTAGATGSYRGLETFGRFLEREGALRQAESVFEGIRTYEDGGDHPLIAFYYRADLVRREPDYTGRFGPAAAEIFPEGLEHFDPSMLGQTVRDGVLVRRDGERMRWLGLRSNDVIVALDGWRVRNLDQFEIVKHFDDVPEMALAVWRDGKLVELRPRVANRLMDSRLASYTAPQ